MAHIRRRFAIHQSCISSDTENLWALTSIREGSHVSSPFSWPHNILKQKQTCRLLLTEGTPLSFHTAVSSQCSLDFLSSVFTWRQHGDQKRQSKVTSSLQGRLFSILWGTADSAFTASLRKFCSWLIADRLQGITHHMTIMPLNHWLPTLRLFLVRHAFSFLLFVCVESVEHGRPRMWWSKDKSEANLINIARPCLNTHSLKVDWTQIPVAGHRKYV